MKLVLIAVVGLVAAFNVAVAAEPKFIGRTEIAATESDKSNEQGTLDGGIPANQWGAFGSGIAWLGQGNLYAVVSDRGPADGKTAYRCRYHVVEITVTENSASPIKVDLLKTQLLSNRAGVPLIGSLNALPSAKDPRGVRFDPEAIRASGNGRIMISDEYGPSILEFTSDGRQVSSVQVPQRLMVAHSSAEPEQELPPKNTRGRQPNRGLESLAISPDGNTIYTLLQSPLLQDGALDDMNKRVGTNVRLIEINRVSGVTREYLYPLDQPINGCNEIEYMAPGRLLIIERDSKVGVDAAVKQIVEIDIRQASDISRIDALPSTGIPAGVTPVAKRPFLNLLDSRLKLAGETFPEKIEGIAFGPTLKDGSRVLLVTSDNDFLPVPTFIYAFSVRIE